LEFDPSDFVQADILGSLKAGFFYEHETSQFFMRIARAGEAFLDVGANVGYFALLMAELMGAGGRTLAFEPNPRCRTLLEAAAARNNLDIAIVPAAVSDRDGTAVFRSNGATDTNGSFDLGGDQGEAYEVETVSLDSYLERSGFPVPKAMKIDVEGAELQVFSGAEKLLADPGLEFVVCEFNIPQLHRFGTSEVELTEFMAAKGLHLYLLDHQGGLPRYVPPGVRVRMTSVANVVFARHEAIRKYWPEVVNECFLFTRQKGGG
jgi:FkbM family methyltransferase